MEGELHLWALESTGPEFVAPEWRLLLWFQDHKARNLHEVMSGKYEVLCPGFSAYTDSRRDHCLGPSGACYFS